MARYLTGVFSSWSVSFWAMTRFTPPNWEMGSFFVQMS
jgi:hypothetical protein